MIYHHFNKLKQRLGVWSLYNREYIVGFILGLVCGILIMLWL